MASTNWPRLLYKFDTAYYKPCFQWHGRDRTPDDAVWHREEPHLCGRCGCNGGGNGPAGPPSVARDPNRGIAPGLVEQRCAASAFPLLAEEIYISPRVISCHLPS